jgi:hypothetical protein
MAIASSRATSRECNITPKDYQYTRSREQMAEAAGLALSVVALLSSCVQGYGALRAMRDRGSEAATIACCLEIEEKRLVLWSRNAGLFDDTCLIPIGDFDTVISTLRQIEFITQDAGTLKSRYKLNEDSPAKDGETRASSRFIKGGPEFSPNQASRGLKRITTARLAMRWLFDRSKYGKIVQDLRTLNDGLNALLNEGQAANYHRDFAIMSLRATSTDNVEVLQAIREAAQGTYEGLASTSDQRFHALKLQTGRPREPASSTAPSIAMSALTMPSTESRQRDIYVLKEKPVILEWRKHRGESPENVVALRTRTAGLANLLGHTPKPQGFRVLDCIGYCDDEIQERFGLVYRIPGQLADTNATLEITSLRDLLQSRSQTKIPLPSLRDRFSLAASLANAILQLHAAKWLHRHVSSANVVFLNCRSSTNDGFHFEDHFIAGFDYSREDKPGALSLPISSTASDVAYQHPDLVAAPRQGYRAAFDAYSLGIILIEIGFWRPIDDFLKPRYSASENRDRLLRNQLHGDLAHRMGTAYEEASRKALCGNLYGDESIAEGEQLVRFFQDIVVPIEKAQNGL